MAVVLGHRDRAAGASDRRQPALVRGGPRGPGVHAAGPARVRLGQQRSRRDFPAIQAEGARVCLFTDQANPTSNKIYAALGYQPVADMANLVIAR